MELLQLGNNVLVLVGIVGVVEFIKKIEVPNLGAQIVQLVLCVVFALIIDEITLINVIKNTLIWLGASTLLYHAVLKKAGYVAKN